jgi:hypothetical protein
VEIQCVEFCGLFQPAEIENFDDPILEVEQVILAQLLKDAIDVDRRQAKDVSELTLRQRQLKFFKVPDSHRRQPHPLFHQEMRHRTARIPTSDIDDPFPKNRGIDQRLAPQSGRDRRTRANDRNQARVCDEAEFGGRGRPNVMIKDVKIQALQIGDIAGDVNGENLSFAVRFQTNPSITRQQCDGRSP